MNDKNIIHNNSIDISNYTDSKTAFFLGYDETETIRTLDIKDSPHILVSGMTGAGKSNFLHGVIADLRTPIIIIDPKQVEFNCWTKYDKITTHQIWSTQAEIYNILSQIDNFNKSRQLELKKSGCVNIEQYNEKHPDNPMTRLVVIVDEYHLALRGKNTRLLSDIITTCRSCGIHFILATQKPTAQNTNSVITSQCATRICFKVAKDNDSRLVLGCSGAEKLARKGDMLVSDGFNKPYWIHNLYFNLNNV